jgi:hypothetical protein
MNMPTIPKKKRFMILPSTGERIHYYGILAGVDYQLALCRDNYISDMNKIIEDYKNSKQTEQDDDFFNTKYHKNKYSYYKEIFDIIMENCFPELDKNIITEKDFEFMIFELRRNSVDNMLEYNSTCPKCGGQNTVKINLNKLEVSKPSKLAEYMLGEYKLLIGNVTFLEYYETLQKTNNDVEQQLFLSSLVIKKLIDGEEVTNFSEFPIDERYQWTKRNIEEEDLIKIVKMIPDLPKILPLPVKKINCINSITSDGKIVNASELKEIINLGGNVPDTTICGHVYDTQISDWIDYFL